MLMPTWVVGAQLLRIARGYAFDPLFLVGAVYVMTAGLLVFGLMKRIRAVWVATVIFTSLGSIVALYMGLQFVRFLLGGTARPGLALTLLLLFHAVFIASFVGALALLLTRQARVEIHGARPVR